MPKYRSATTTHGRNMAGARALWRATGMTDADFGKPIIAVVNSFTQFVPGHVHLRDLGNTVIVVEHDEDAIRAADHVIDIGPGAGVHGGEVVAEGPLEAIMAVPESLTGQYMSGKRKIEVPKKRVPANPEKVLKLTGAHGNNLKDVTLTLPVGLFTCITGVSGSGKSTLINDTLFPIAQRQLNGATIAEPAPYRDIQGLEHFDKVIDIDQSPIRSYSAF